MTTNTKALAVLPLVERLREHAEYGYVPFACRLALAEAADTIERQDTNLARMRESLETIANDPYQFGQRIQRMKNIARQALAERGRG